MSLNYNTIDTLKLLLNSFKYNIFISIVIGSIIFIIIITLNKKSKIVKYLVGILNVILIFLILYYYLKHILSFKFENPINNIYFYFFNSVIYLFIVSIINFKFNKTVINNVFYGMSLINILFSLFMTYYLNNIDIIVIGNIFPMIKFGNIIYIVYYVFLFVCIINKYKKSSSLF